MVSTGPAVSTGSNAQLVALDRVVSTGSAVSAGPNAQLVAVFSDVRQAFAGAAVPAGHLGSASPYPRPSAGGLSAGVPAASPGPGVSRDLLEATDYITGAVTSLVRELHSGQTS